MLVEDTTCTSREMISNVVRGTSKEAIEKIFSSLVLTDKIRTAV